MRRSYSVGAFIAVAATLLVVPSIATAQFTANDTVYFGATLPSVSGTPLTFAGTPVSADFNKDGHADVAIPVSTKSGSNTSGGFVVMLGNGYSRLTPQPAILAPTPACSTSGTVCGSFQITAADLNGDGNPDLVISLIASSGSYPNTVYTPMAFLYPGKGDGTFQSPLDISNYVGGYGAAVAADLRHNGKLDLISQTISGPVEVALSNGDGTFQTPTVLPCVTDRGCLSSFAVGDLGNGQVDIVLSVSSADANCGFICGGIAVLLGNGDGTFKVGASYPDLVEADPFVGLIDFPDMVLGNFGPDHKMGVSVIYYNPQTQYDQYAILLLNGNGDGTFAAPRFPNLDLSSIDILTSEVAGDINGDGSDDLVFAAVNYGIDDPVAGPGKLAWLLATGKGRFTAPHPVTVVKPAAPACANVRLQAPAFTLADLTGNGRMDAIGAFAGSACYVVFHNAETTTTLTSSANPGTYLSPITLQATIAGSMTTGGSALIPPAGGVSLYDSGKLLGSRPVTSGVATFSDLMLTAGTHNLTATYTGNYSYLTSTSAPLAQTIDGIPTAISLSSSANPINYNDSVTFTATISAPTAPAGKLAGTPIALNFYNNGTLFASRVVDSTQTATVTTKFRAGTHAITVQYTGNTVFAPSTSNLVTLQVN
jgi:hypothetical protein